MTNYNERLYEILVDNFEDVRVIGCTVESIDRRIAEAKRALTSLIKELVAEAKPGKKHVGDEVAENRSYTGERLFNATVDDFEQNILKGLEAE